MKKVLFITLVCIITSNFLYAQKGYGGGINFAFHSVWTMNQNAYGDPELDWVILITNNITNVRDQWPLNNNDLYNYMIDKYGSDAALTDIHHYETTEIKDQYDRLVIGSGFEVDEDFTVSYTTFDNLAITANPVKSVTNYEYEVGINEDKRQIRVLKSQFLSVVITDMRNIMKYDESSQYVNQSNKKAYNPQFTGV